MWRASTPRQAGLAGGRPGGAPVGTPGSNRAGGLGQNPGQATGRPSRSAPWTAAERGAPRAPAQRPAAPLRSAPALPGLVPPLRLCPRHRHCSGARGRRSRLSRTEISLQRDLAPDIRLARGEDAGGVGLPSAW